MDSRPRRRIRIDGGPLVAAALSAAVGLGLTAAGGLGTVGPGARGHVGAAGYAMATPETVALLLAMFTIAEVVPIRLGGWRPGLVPLAMVVGVVTAGPAPATVGAVAAALILAAVRLRRVAGAAQRGAVRFGPSVAAAAVFAASEGRIPLVVGAIGAGAVFSLADRAVAWLGAEGRERAAVGWFDLAAPVATGLASATSALALVRLYEAGPALPALLAPLLGGVVVGARVLADRQAEHDRLGRLAGASAHTTGLRSFDDAVAQAATEAGPLVNGTVAVSLAVGEDGAIVCSVVDAAGARPGSPELSAALGEWIATSKGSHPTGADLPQVLRALRPGLADVVVAGALDATRPGSLAVVVLRSAPPDDESDARSSLLETFVGHAGLVATNALLFQRVEAALRDQVDINRQKNEFLAAVSHELRTPLASMLASVETLRRLDGKVEPEARDRFFTIAHRQGKRLQRLIEELLLTASLDHRQEMVVTAPCPLPELLDEVAVDLALQSDARIHVACEPGAEVVTTDPNRIRQVITNLVENATKYAPGGRIEVVAAPRGDRVEIAVIDHGPGIAPEDRDRAFERFVQLDGSSTRAQGGTGLGLYLCRRVADLLEAELTLVETPGGGATFVLSVPRAHSAALRGEAGPDRPLRSGPAPSLAAGERFERGPYLDRALLDLTRGPSSGPAAGLGARPVVPAGLKPQGWGG